MLIDELKKKILSYENKLIQRSVFIYSGASQPLNVLESSQWKGNKLDYKVIILGHFFLGPCI